MMSDEDREYARLELQAIEADLNWLTARVAEDSAQRHTRPEAIAAMEHLLVLFETMRDGYRTVMEALDQEAHEQVGELLDELEALRTRLLQWLGPR